MPICSPISGSSYRNQTRVVISGSVDVQHCCLAPRLDLLGVTQKVRANKHGNEPNIVGSVDERGKLRTIFAKAECAGGLQGFCIRKGV